MKPPESIGSIFEHPDSKPDFPEIDLPFLGKSTLHVVTTIDLSAATLTPHIPALKQADFVATPLNVLHGGLVNAVPEVAALRNDTSDLSDEQALLKSQYAVNKAIKKTKVKNWTDMDVGILGALWSSGVTDVFHADLDLKKDQPLTRAIIEQDKKGKQLTERPQASYEELAHQESERLAEQAKVTAQRDLILAQKMAAAIEVRAKGTNKYVHGVWMLSALQTGALFILRDWGLPDEHITPYSEAAIHYSRQGEAIRPEHEDGSLPESLSPEAYTQRLRVAKRISGLLSPWDIVVDPTSQALLKLIAGRKLTGQDISRHIVNRTIGLRTLYDLAEQNPNAHSENIFKTYATVCQAFEPDEVESLYNSVSPRSEEIYAVFAARFKEHFHALAR